MGRLRAGIHFLQFRIRRNSIYAGLIGLVVSTYLFGLISVLNYFKYNPDLFIYITSLAVCFAALGFHPLEKKLGELTDSIFYKKRAGYHKTITEMLRKMSGCNNLNSLTSLIVNTIFSEMKTLSLAFYLKSGDKKSFEIVQHHHWQNLDSILGDDFLIECLSEHKQVMSKVQLLSLMRSRLVGAATRLKERRLFYRLNSAATEVVVPFFEKEELIGFLMLGEKASEDPYFDEEINLLESIGNQAVLGLQSARLFEISQNKVKEITTLFEVGKMMNSTLDIKEIFANIIKAVIKVINVDRGILFLFDDKTEQLFSVSGYGASEKDILGITLSVGDSVLGRIFKVGSPVLVPHTTRQTEYVKRLGVETYIVVPMKARDRVIGLLTIDNAPSKRSLENTNMDLLMTLASQMAIAIENAKLYDEAREKVKELSTLNENILRLKSYNENILETMPSGVVSFDNEGRIVTFNNMAELIMGKTESEVLHIHHEALWAEHPDLIKAVGSPSANVLVNYKDKKGKLKPLNVNTRELKDAKNIKVGMLSVITDMSELKNLEQQVRRSDRVSALGTMVAGVAHEIKNPLTSMKMFIQLMEENKQNKNFWDEFGSIIATEVDRLETIVEDFLGFARTPEINIKPVLLNDITERVYKLVKTQSRKDNVDLVINVAENILIKADTQKIMQVLLNLILNAIQAMQNKTTDDRGRVALTAEKDLANNSVNITLEDNGSGISKENLEKLFTPFFTTKQKGTGLGLSIAHKIIQEHGGSIDVVSEIGKGTTFSIVLPLVEAMEVVSTPVR